MKKRLLLFIVLMLLFLGTVLAEESVREVLTTEIDGYTWLYTKNAQDEALIVEIPRGLASIRLPETLAGIPVKGFDETRLWGNVSYSLPEQVIEIPAFITWIPSNPFVGKTGITAFSVAADHPVFEAVDGVLYSKEDKRLVAYPDARKGDTYEVVAGTRIIGINAFATTNTLDVTIPDSVVEIGDHAMYLFGSSQIDLPKGLKRIGDYAFTPIMMNTVTIPKDIEHIGINPFASCSWLSEIKLVSNNRYAVVKGVLFDKKEKLLISYPSAKRTETYTVPKDTKAIGASAFEQAQINGIKLTDAVTSIGDRAFSASMITTMQLPGKLTHLGEEVFTSAYNLSSFVFPGYLKQVPKGTFSNSGLQSIELENGVEGIGECAFQMCMSLTEVKLPNSLQIIGEQAFSYCESLARLQVPASVTAIGDMAFEGADVTLVVVEGSYAQEYAMQHNIKHELQPESWSDLLEIPDPKHKEDANFSDFIEYVVNKEEVTISRIQTQKRKFIVPAEIEGYPVKMLGQGNEGMDLFGGNFACTELVLPEGLEGINDYCFQGDYTIKKVNLPKTLRTIGAGAFSTNYISSIKIPASVEFIGDGAFHGMFMLQSFTLDKKNPYFVLTKGMLIHQQDQVLISVPSMKKMKSLKVPDGIVAIAPKAFAGTSIDVISLPDSVRTIGAYAFFSSNIKEIVIPSGVKEIAAGSFTGGGKVASITLPEGLEKIGPHAFQGNGLTSITLPASLKEIGADAFAYCDKLKTVEGLHSGIAIAPSAFINCTMLETPIP